MPFGNIIPWNKGKKTGRLSDEHRRKISIAGKGRKLSEEHKRKIGLKSKGRQSWAKGKKFSDEHKKKIAQSRWKGGLPKCKICSKKLTNYSSKICKQCYVSILRDRKGEKHPLWKGGNNERHILMGQLEYKLWRKSIFERDNYTCIWCGKHGGDLEADHIKRWADFPELRYAIDNGRTLCRPCHETTFKVR